METRLFEINLYGRFQLIDPAGKEILVNRAKVQALLALLASEPRMARSRIWLQDKLWSDSSPEKSANSLRQTLHNLRQLFGDWPDCVRANRTVISLNADHFRLGARQHGEFLEGIDVPDPEFETWLVTERSQRSGTLPVSSAKPVAAPPLRQHVHRTKRGLAIECANDSYSRLGQFELFFADVVRKSIREVLDFEPVAPNGQGADALDVITLGIQAHHGPHGQVVLRLAAYQGASTAACWAESAQGDFPTTVAALPPEFLNLSCRISAMLSTQLSQAGSGIAVENDANYYASAGIRQMYSMMPGSIREASVLFAKAEETQTRGLFFALRAQLAIIDFVESDGANRDELREMADEYCAKALHMEGTNSVVLSAAAHARLVFENDRDAAAELGKLGVLSNSANPVAWSSWANVLLNCGKIEDAARAARMALRLSKDTYYRYWTEFQYATTAVALNNTSDAITHAESARALNPRYRPAMRYLIGLYANAESFMKAKSALQRLQRFETQTSVDRLVKDDKYPVSMMRSAGLINPDKLSEIT